MDRRLFISRLGAGAGVPLAVTCLGSCMRDIQPDPSGIPVEFSLEDFPVFMEAYQVERTSFMMVKI